jgi:hypothetical protein
MRLFQCALALDIVQVTGAPLEQVLALLASSLIRKKAVVPYFEKLKSLDRPTYILVLERLLAELQHRDDALFSQSLGTISDGHLKGNVLLHLGLLDAAYDSAVQVRDTRLIRRIGNRAASIGQSALATKCAEAS